MLVDRRNPVSRKRNSTLLRGPFGGRALKGDDEQHVFDEFFVKQVVDSLTVGEEIVGVIGEGEFPLTEGEFAD